MRFFKFLFSGALMGILLVIFAIAIGYATFLENDFDTTTAKMLVYNARWFELLLLLMIINFLGMVFTKKLYRKSKLNILVIHVALVIIIVGAGITRYIGFEGQMHIRQGQTTNSYISLDTYFNVQLENNSGKENHGTRIWLTNYRDILFDETIDFDESSFQISIDQYLPNAVESLVKDENGTPLLNLVSAGRNGRQDTRLKYGESINLDGINIGFGDTSKIQNVLFVLYQGELLMKSRMDFSTWPKVDSIFNTEQFMPVVPMQFYRFGEMDMMVKDFSEKSRYEYLPVANAGQQGSRVIKVNVKNSSQSRDIYLTWGKWEDIQMKGVTLSLNFGNQPWVLPFSLRLNDFQLERYPGSMSPSSFASEVTLIDEEKGIEKPYRIFMNNILEYQGYRFYQSSYDKDEKGTILSINHDYWGTMVTYIGYFLLFASLIISLITKKTRFRRLSQQIKETHEQRKKLLISIAIILFVYSGHESAVAKDTNEISKTHAASFGKLLSQSKDGRIIPVNSNSNKVLVKVYKKSSYEGLSADQVLLGMVTNPQHWQNEPIIKVGDPDLQKLLGIHEKHARYSDFFNAEGQYVLKAKVDETYAKKPALRNMFDKELIYVDERVNVSYMVYNGAFLKCFPIPNHPNNKWMSPFELQQDDPNFKTILILFSNYLDKLEKSIESRNYTEAEDALQLIKNYQIEVGGTIIPPAMKTNLEVFYNNSNIFKRLFPVYMLLGMVLFGFFFVQIFKPAMEFKLFIKVLISILIAAFITQTFVLGLRWYISGHAPWSNGYESMIYISWATMLAGFIFMRKSPIILSVTSLLAGVTLLTAHMSWMNPEITNLVPVLKSYWLTIHVALITASYGFLGLGALTGFLNLCIMIFRNAENAQRINLTLKELSLIIELSLSVGLILLIMGNFLGGIWANESWGRYWGWDPKETWSLVTIIVYSFILHMRLIPGIRSTFSFNFLAMFGFGCVLMTYFGVNYYLSGLHSYASGDPVPIPTFVYYTLAVTMLISILAAYNNYKLINFGPEEN